jgi:hypothetical protein
VPNCGTEVRPTGAIVIGSRFPMRDFDSDAVAAGAASTLEVGAGRFDPREAARLRGNIRVEQLEPVAS